jgi:HAD superfamily hydrolase (TIGR01490 family)
VSVRVAFFDLDRTLIARNSASLWIRWEWDGGRISPRQALQAVGWVLRYNLGATEMGGVLRRTVGTLRGQVEAEVRARTLEFYAARVRSTFRPGARPVVEAHRAAGDRLVLLTSVSNYLGDAVREELGLDDVVCNRFEVDAAGRYTGRAFEPLCFGPGKVTLARQYVEARGARLEDAVFYSDSRSDLPMLAAVGRPVVVHPDPRLRREARRRGWEIVTWGVP